jgi:hypothetical protein
MPYVNVSARFAVLAHAPWYTLEDLLAEISALRKIDFSVVTQRAQALERLNNIRQVVPFQANNRFADGYYVCEVLGDWSRKFQQLKSALSHRDNKELKSVAKPEIVDQQSFADAQQAFWNSTTAMYDQLIRTDGLVDRGTFELQYQWQ